MPDISTYSGIPVPTDGETNDLAGILAAFRSTMDPQLVLKATSVSNRDTLYGGTTGATAVPLGSLVSCAALKTVWMKTSAPPSAATWATIAEVGTPVTTGVVTAATNWTVAGQWAQRVNGGCLVRVDLSYSGSTITASDTSSSVPGNIGGDPLICTMQSAWLLNAGAAAWPETFSMAGGPAGEITIYSTGAVNLLSFVPSGTITSGATIRFKASYPGV